MIENYLAGIERRLSSLPPTHRLFFCAWSCQRLLNLLAQHPSRQLNSPQLEWLETGTEALWLAATKVGEPRKIENLQTQQTDVWAGIDLSDQADFGNFIATELVGALARSLDATRTAEPAVVAGVAEHLINIADFKAPTEDSSLSAPILAEMKWQYSAFRFLDENRLLEEDARRVMMSIAIDQEADAFLNDKYFEGFDAVIYLDADSVEILRPLLRDPRMRSVQSISIWNLDIPGATLLADEAHTPHLKRFALHDANIGDSEAVRMLEKMELASLSELSLLDTRLGPDSAAALAQRSEMRLKSLALHGNQFRDGGCELLSGATNLAELEYLEARANEIGGKGAAFIAQSNVFRKLQVLDLSENAITDDGAIAIGGSAYLKNLSELNLAYNQIGQRGCIAILQSETLSSVSRLNLWKNVIGAMPGDVVQSLTILRQLVELSLKNNEIGSEFVKAIVANEHIKRLEVLKLGNCNLDENAGLALLEWKLLSQLRTLEVSKSEIGAKTMSSLRKKLGERLVALS